MATVFSRKRTFGEILASPDQDAFRSINSKRIDILIVDRAGWPVVAVEYQGSGHYQGTAAIRDAVKKEALLKAGVRYVEVLPTRAAIKSDCSCVNTSLGVPPGERRRELLLTIKRAERFSLFKYLPECLSTSAYRLWDVCVGHQGQFPPRTHKVRSSVRSSPSRSALRCALSGAKLAPSRFEHHGRGIPC